MLLLLLRRRRIKLPSGHPHPPTDMLPEATVRDREPCENDPCPDRSRCTFYCVNCDCSFCDTCWDKQPPHKPNKRGSDGHAHEKIDRLVVKRYRDILEPPSSIDEQEALYKDDEDTTWFGISHNRAGDPVFEDYERYATLMGESLPQTHGVRYPQLVSFIGQTGKSSQLSLVLFTLLTNSRSRKKHYRKDAHQSSGYEDQFNVKSQISITCCRICQ